MPNNLNSKKMRKNILNILLVTAAAFGFCSCVQDNLDPLTGKYPKPGEVNLTEAQVADIAKDGAKRTFSINFSGNGNTLAAKFIANDYFLPAASYTPADAEFAKKGNYLIGAGGTTLNGKAVASGSLNVTKDEDAYTMSGTVWDSDGTAYRISYAGDIHFEADPVAVALTKVLSVADNSAYGTPTLTLVLASDGVDSYYDTSTWSNVYTGDGYYLSLDIYTPDGKLHPGSYAPCAVGGSVAEGQYGIGYDPGDIYGWGIMFTDWGTCWWTVDNSVTSAQHVESGNIEVELSGSKYTITLNQGKGGIFCEFKGNIEDLVPGGGSVEPDYYFAEVVSDVYDASYAVVSGVKSHTVYIASDAAALAGGETLASFVLILADGVDELEGTYEVCEYASEPYKAGNGYDLSAWGWGFGGSYWYNAGELVLINPGETVTVSKLADGCYSFSGDGYEFVAADDSFASGGGGDPDYVELVNFISAASNLGNGVNSVTLNLATEGVSATYDSATWSMVYSGTGHYLATDIYSADGQLAEGTYTACAVGGTIGEGEFGIGYDTNMWGFDFFNWGTCWWTVDDGSTSAEKLTDGTITVSKDGSTYTIIYDNGTLAARYIGEITL